jgi:hypothetical protein
VANHPDASHLLKLELVEAGGHQARLPPADRRQDEVSVNPKFPPVSF